MSKRISEAYIRKMELGHKRWAERKTSPRLRLLDVVQDGAAKTFVYELPGKEGQRIGFWDRLLGNSKKMYS